MKEWLTAAELAAERLPELPHSDVNVRKMADRLGWTDHPVYARPRSGRGGGIEYNIALLPTVARIAFERKHRRVSMPEPAAEGAATVAPAGESPTPPSARAARERDARLAIVAAFTAWWRGQTLRSTSAQLIFASGYNAGSIAVDGWIREAVPTLSVRTLARWRAAAKAGETARLAVDRGLARKGKGVLDTANGGAVRTFILAAIAHQPMLSAAHLRKLIRSEFGETLETSAGPVAVPPVRTIQHFAKVLREAEAVTLARLSDPDRYRSTMAPSGVGTYRHLTRPNALWMIDASPVDALCVDGRHAIYVCLDIATRRVVLYVSRTPRAAAVALLTRKAILALGVPEAIKTDNGSDFVARDTARLFASLGIEAERSDAYSPQQKGHVERVIRTFQHDFATLLPGFTGHSVADRKRIEDRKGFADRLGADTAELFGVELTGARLQQLADEWVEVTYQHRPHEGLKGRTPFEVAAAAGGTMRTVDARALDLLLMPVAGGDGTRTVTKFGVRIDHHHYVINAALPGDRVVVRMDPMDAGRAYAFDAEDGRFVGEAICPELAGIDPARLIAEKRAVQAEILGLRDREARAEIKRLTKGKALVERVLEVDRRDVPNVVAFPKREVAHETRAIAAALDAMETRPEPATPAEPVSPAQAKVDAVLRRQADEAAWRKGEEELLERLRIQAEAHDRAVEAARTAHLPAGVTALPETAKERYRRSVAVAAGVASGEAIEPDVLIWLGRYQTTAEYRGQRKVHEADPTYLDF